MVYVNAYTYKQLLTNHLSGCDCLVCGEKETTIKQSNSTKLFIEKARKVHGDKYDYSKVDYINAKTKVYIICPEHGIFKQEPKHHLSRHGCPVCSGNKPLNSEEFVKRAKKIYSNKYDYSKVNYKNAKTEVCIICSKHGEFWQNPDNHLKGHGCSKCGSELAANKRKMTTKEFIKKAKEVHGDKYDYSKVKYVNANTIVHIICPEHGEFPQTPSAHANNGQGCPTCSGNKKMTTEEFIKKAKEVHGDKYDYSKVDYINSTTKVCIICPEHGEFWQYPSSHLKAHGCSKCVGREKTTEEFIKEAKEIHSNKYDYSKVDYINSTTEVCIICPEHREFWQKPSSHLSGSGCPKCVGKFKTTDEFIKEAKAIHGDKYDYSKVDYKNAKTEVCIICPEHGKFWQVPSIHLNGSGCPECGKKQIANKNSSNTDEFIQKAKEIHGDKYDYSKVDYKNSTTKVCIICPEHGEFWQIPSNHLKGHECSACTNNKLLNLREFIQKAKEIHGDKYDYSKVDYINSTTKVCIICPEHGEFWQYPGHHWAGRGCRFCGGTQLKTTEEFIKKAKAIHGDKYDYSKVNYINSETKVCIICPEHGEFLQTPESHLHSMCGCPICKESKLEKDVRINFEKNNISDFIYQFKTDFLKTDKKGHSLTFDFYSPSKKIAIECQGKQHYTYIKFFHRNKAGFEYQKIRDQIKKELCQKNGITLLYYTSEEYRQYGMFDNRTFTDLNDLLKAIV